MALTFENLFPLGERPVSRPVTNCQALLPNHMQCPKGSSWIVTDDSTEPPTQTQYCAYHAKVTQQNYENELLNKTQTEETSIKEELKNEHSGNTATDPAAT